MGGIVEMVMDPHLFWEKQRAYAFPGLSWNSIVGWFTVMVSDPALIRHVFNHNRWARAAGARPPRVCGRQGPAGVRVPGPRGPPRQRASRNVERRERVAWHGSGVRQQPAGVPSGP